MTTKAPEASQLEDMVIVAEYELVENPAKGVCVVGQARSRHLRCRYNSPKAAAQFEYRGKKLTHPLKYMSAFPNSTNGSSSTI